VLLSADEMREVLEAFATYGQARAPGRRF